MVLLQVSCWTKLAKSKLFGSTCTLLVACETTREVVQIFFGPGKIVEACQVQHLLEPLVSNNFFGMASLYKLAGAKVL